MLSADTGYLNDSLLIKTRKIRIWLCNSLRIIALRGSLYRHTIAKTNGMIERGHKPIINALAKMTKNGINTWIRNLYAVL
jgi:hypothetical protein